MTTTTRELEDKLKKILKLQSREEVSMALFEELSEKATKYKEMIEFLKDDDVDTYLKVEEKELDEQLLKEHTGQK